MDNLSEYINLAVIVFIFVIGLLFLCAIILFIIDITQNKHAIRRNYPLVGRFRYFFEDMGEFFRQYFFAQDREEMPFNRAQRSWIYRSAKNIDNMVAFGSTKDLTKKGALIFKNSFIPVLQEDAEPTKPMIIGEYCDNPYAAKSFFNISAMSFGALSSVAVKALSKGAEKSGIWLNTGEGGLSPYHLSGGCDIIFQIGTAKYGVRDENGDFCDEKLKEVASHEQVKMFEIKLSQGAKPGKGGILPAEKVTAEIARIRGIPEAQASISDNRHKEINNVSELLDMVNHIRHVTGKPVGFKAVMGSYEWLEEMCLKIKEMGAESAPDYIVIDGCDGGTGAAPLSLMDNVGLPLRESLPEVAKILEFHRLKSRIKIVASGKMVNPADVAWALSQGADFINSARGFMFALGCIQAMKCSKNNCPTGITTHNKRLQKGLDVEGKAERVANYAKNMIKEVEVIAHSCGHVDARLLTKDNVKIVGNNC